MTAPFNCYATGSFFTVGLGHFINRTRFQSAFFQQLLTEKNKKASYIKVYIICFEIECIVWICKTFLCTIKFVHFIIKRRKNKKKENFLFFLFLSYQPISHRFMNSCTWFSHRKCIFLFTAKWSKHFFINVNCFFYMNFFVN